MLDLARLFDELAGAGLGEWRPLLEDTVRERLSDTAHGDMPRWRAALATLPAPGRHPASLDARVVSVGPPAFPPGLLEAVRATLMSLGPWRKGPFRIGDIRIDAEWRSDLKWERVAGAMTPAMTPKMEPATPPAMAPLAGRRVLDVGCGNGYYALRMRGAGAALVIGIDPTLNHLAQFEAIRHWLPPEPVRVLPLRLEDLPPGGPPFDTVFSMGVLYHRREPGRHLAQLGAVLSPGGDLVLETLVSPGDSMEVLEPRGRYARMRNVWHLPTIPQLLAWVEQAGFAEPALIDVSRTTPDEQRTTPWMPFESLAEALDPADPLRTIEGWPAPRRALLVAHRPHSGQTSATN